MSHASRAAGSASATSSGTAWAGWKTTWRRSSSRSSTSCRAPNPERSATRACVEDRDGSSRVGSRRRDERGQGRDPALHRRQLPDGGAARAIGRRRFVPRAPRARLHGLSRADRLSRGDVLDQGRGRRDGAGEPGQHRQHRAVPRPQAPRSGAMTQDPLHLDYAAEADRIGRWIVETLANRLHRRGLVVAISGGIDSSVCAALAVRALGARKVFGLLLPERDSSPSSAERGRLLASHLGIGHEVFDIAPALEALGCYRQRDEAIRRVFPEYGEGWRNKIVIAGGTAGGINFFKLVVASADGAQQDARLPLREYLQIVAATNFKQRVRKTMDYFHADRLNYAVVGTPNRLEYDQGFFVKVGDGAADLKPIAHLYKTQVYAMARHLGLPEDICSAQPTTDTYTLPQGQDEFYFALPYAQMDRALWSLNHGLPADDLATSLGVSTEQA